MGIRVPTEKMLQRMSPSDRWPLGKAGVTAAEADAKYLAKCEKELQKLMCQELTRRDIFYSRARMDKRTTTIRGLYDFSIIMPGGRHLAVEAKMPGGVISDAQKKLFDRYWDQTGEVVHIVLGFDQFVLLLNEHSNVHT